MGPRQVIIQIKNRTGELSLVNELLGEHGISIKAMTVSTDGDIGTTHMVLDDHERGKLVLHGAGYEIKETPVIAAYAPDHPGGLVAVIKPLREAMVNIVQFYISVAKRGEHVLVIIEVDDYEKGVAALAANYVEIIKGELTF